MSKSKGVIPMSEKISQKEITGGTIQEVEDAAQISEYAILRFARFLLSRMQNELEREEH